MTESEPEDDVFVNKRRLMSGFFRGRSRRAAGEGPRAAGCTHPHNGGVGGGVGGVGVGEQKLNTNPLRTVESVFQLLCDRKLVI